VARKPKAVADSSPSVNGHWLMAAFSSGCRLATWIAWPPPKELPQIATRLPSTSGLALMNSSAASQSANWRRTDINWRGVPPLSPK
jgi:hypothetical protein